MNINLLNNDEVTLLRDLIDSSKKAVIFCHTNADGDSLGSSLTWAEYLRQHGVEATVIAPDKYPDFLQWMPGSQTVVRFDKKPDLVKKLLDEADLFCILDLNTISRIGDTQSQLVAPYLSSSAPACWLSQSSATERTVNHQPSTILIDHHLNPDIPCTLQVSHPTLSSTSELVFRVIWQLGGYDAFTHNMAVTTYCGMMTDTGGFTYNSTQPEIYFIISQLLAKGIDKDRIYRNVYHVFSLYRLRLTGYVLYQKLKVLTPLRASYYTISREDQKRFKFIKGDAEGLVNMPLQIKGHRLSISLREDTDKPNLVWVSLRSVDDFPCNEMAAQYFNGGGHKNASGGRLFCSLPEAEQVTRTAIKAYANRL